MIPKTIERELTKLVRDRDRWKRRALDRSPDRSHARRTELAARDEAVRNLLFLAGVEGYRGLSRGGVGCLWRALEALRPDITATMPNGLDDAHAALSRFFPTEDDG